MMKSVKRMSCTGLSSELPYRKKYRNRVLAGLMILNIFFISSECVAKEKNNESMNVAASVNGVPIAMASLDPTADGKLKKYKKYGVGSGDKEMQKYLRMQVLDRLIATELLYQEAKKLKIDNLEERVTESAKLIKDRQFKGKISDPQQIRDALAKKVIIDEYLLRQKISGVNVPEAEVLAYYNDNKNAFKQEERIRSRHILVSVSTDAESEEKKAALAEITKVRKLLQEGKPFAEVAKEYSDCNSSSSGGELGYHEKGYMPKAYDEVAFSLKIEKLSDIVETQHGYHVIEVLDRQSAGVQTYDQVKDFITRYLNMEHRKKAMEEHVSSLRNKAKIDIYL